MLLGKSNRHSHVECVLSILSILSARTKKNSLTFFAFSHASVGHGQRMLQIFRSPNTQAIFNEAGLSVLNLYTGYVTFYFAYPLALEGRLPYLMAFADRLLRHVPAVGLVVCFDFIWPLLFTGPLYERVARFTLDKCTKHWWASVFMINTNLAPVEIVSASCRYTHKRRRN